MLAPQGEIARSVLFIRDGTVALSGLAADGSERSLGIRGPRSVLCWEAMRGLPSPAEVRTLSETRICAMPASDAVTWAGPPQSPARALLSLLVDELVQREEELEARSGDTLGRVARFLLSWPQNGEKTLRKQVIARALGMRPETFSRALTKLVQRGVIARGPKLSILDRAALEAIAEEKSEVPAVA